MLQSNTRESMSSREREEFKQEKEAAQMQIDFQLRAKELELEIAKIEARWSSWLRLPMAIIMLPVRLLFGVAYIVAVARKHDPGERFWDFIR